MVFYIYICGVFATRVIAGVVQKCLQASGASDIHKSPGRVYKRESKVWVQNKGGLVLWRNVSPIFSVEWSVLKLWSDIFGEPFCILSGCLGEAVSGEGNEYGAARRGDLHYFVLEAEQSPAHEERMSFMSVMDVD